MIKLNFRPISLNDNKSLYNFFQSLSKKSKSTFQPHPFTLKFSNKIVKNYNSKLRLRFVAVVKNTIVGYSFLHRLPIMPSHAYFGISVSDSFQSKGIGTKLLQHLIIYAIKNNIKYIFLNVFDTNKKAIRVYAKLGFKVYKPQFLFQKIFILYELLYNGTLLDIFINDQNNNESKKVIWMKKKIA